jgi:hypothetical protein
VGHLRLALRALLVDQGFVVIHAHVSKLNLENPIGTHGLHPANVDCPDCKGTAKWTNMVDCVRKVAGDVLGAGGSRHGSASNAQWP